MSKIPSALVTRSGILIQITPQCPNYTGRCTEVHSTLWSVRANSFPRVQFVQIVQRCVQFVQTVPANLVHSSPRPATGNQAKIDIDPLSCLHRWNSSPKIPTEQKYSNHRQNGKTRHWWKRNLPITISVVVTMRSAREWNQMLPKYVLSSLVHNNTCVYMTAWAIFKC